LNICWNTTLTQLAEEETLRSKADKEAGKIEEKDEDDMMEQLVTHETKILRKLTREQQLGN
jgi:hypothetical protein